MNMNQEMKDNMMDVRDGFLNAGIIADENGRINSWACSNNLSITNLEIPNTITFIGNNAFKGCANLKTIIFEAGGDNSLSLGMMSFANCKNLKFVLLPGRTVGIGKGCFRDCEALEEIVIGEGRAPLIISDHLFDNCSGKIFMEEIVADEVERRAAFQVVNCGMRTKRRAIPEHMLLKNLRQMMPSGVIDREIVGAAFQQLYSMMVTNDEFKFSSYARKFESACNYYSGISDWGQATEDEIAKLFIGRMAKQVAYANFGEIPESQFLLADKSALRRICGSISNLRGDESEDDLVASLEESFCSLFTDQRHYAVFHRTIASLCPHLVVPVSAVAKLAPVYAWLSGVSYEESLQLGWYRVSKFVRVNLATFLPGKSVYEVGVFAWYLSEAFREDLGESRKDARRRKEIVLKSLRKSGILR